MTDALFDLDDFGIRIEPTDAMRKGHQVADQCAWCGALVVWNVDVYRARLDTCPACSHKEAGWWRQALPVASVHEHDHEWVAVGAVESCTACGKTRAFEAAVA